LADFYIDGVAKCLDFIIRSRIGFTVRLHGNINVIAARNFGAGMRRADVCHAFVISSGRAVVDRGEAINRDATGFVLGIVSMFFAVVVLGNFSYDDAVVGIGSLSLAKLGRGIAPIDNAETYEK